MLLRFKLFKSGLKTTEATPKPCMTRTRCDMLSMTLLKTSLTSLYRLCCSVRIPSFCDLWTNYFLATSGDWTTKVIGSLASETKVFFNSEPSGFFVKGT